MAENNHYEIAGRGPAANEIEGALTGIFHEIRLSAVAAGIERVSWQANGSKTGRQQRSPSLTEAYLYDGAAGTALFLGAYYSVTRDPAALQLALQYIVPLRTELRQLTEHDRPVAIGGMIGLGSILYTLFRLADWLREPELLDLAQKAATCITPERILADRKLDVVEGCAGALLALLAFAQEATTFGIDHQPSLNLALACGQHLLDRRVSYKSGPRAWPTIGPLPVPGFAHGAAGISYALAKLFEHTGREEFRDAAVEGFAFERCLYIPRERGWLDPRFDRLTGEASWRHGAPGIALGRLGSISSIGLPGVRYDLEEALNITRSLPDSPTDQLCCGNFGRIDILHTAGMVLERLHMSEYAQQLSKRLLDRAKTSGFSFEWPSLEVTRQRQSNPSLFTGLAGIGYVLLRLVYPGMFSSILLLEPMSQM